MSCRHLVNKGTDTTLDLRLCKGLISTILRTISFTILAVFPHKICQIVASVPLVLQILAQLNDCAIHLVWVEMVSRTTWRRFFLLLHTL